MSFDSKSVLNTGADTGLGFEAVVKFARHVRLTMYVEAVVEHRVAEDEDTTRRFPRRERR